MILSSAHSFSKILRLRKPRDFTAVFDQAHCLRSKHFTVLVRNNLHSHARIGITVAKRRVRRSVDRNRIKRLVRESFRLSSIVHLAFDIVIIAKNVSEIPNETLSKCLNAHWRSFPES